MEGGGGTLLHSDRSVCLHSCSLKIFFSVSVASQYIEGIYKCSLGKQNKLKMINVVLAHRYCVLGSRLC